MSDGGRRRLLADGFEDAFAKESSASRHEKLVESIRSFDSWNKTAEPCRELVAVFLDTSSSHPMSVLDMQTLEQCVGWREVGRSIMAELNMSRMVPANASSTDCCSHMFMSVQDLVSVVASNKGVGLLLAEKLVFVADKLVRNTVLFRHAMSLWDTAKQHISIMYLEALWQRVAESGRGRGGGGGENNATNTSNVFGLYDGNSSEVRALKRFMREHRMQVAMFHAFANAPAAFEKGMASAVYYEDEHENSNRRRSDKVNETRDMKNATTNNHTTSAFNNRFPSAAAHSGRRLMMATEPSPSLSRSPVDVYSSIVASTSGFSMTSVASARTGQQSNIPLVTSSWLEGPLGWPPKYSTVYLSNDTCPAGDSALETALEVFRVVRLYYESDFAAKVSQPPWDLSKNLPRAYVPASSSSGEDEDGQVSAAESTRPGSAWELLSTAASDQGSWAPLMYGSMLGAVHDYAPWAEESATGFFTVRRGSSVPSDAVTVGNLAHDLLVCEFDNVMFCGREMSSDGGGIMRVRRNIFLCTIIGVVGWVVVAALLGLIPLIGSACTTLIYAGLPVLAVVTGVHLAYGMAATCFPLVPTCVLQDVILTLQSMLPMQIVWPNSLQVYDRCIDFEKARGTNSSTPVSTRQVQQACMRSCRQEPFYFQRWEDSAAWLLCSLDSDRCTYREVELGGLAPGIRSAALNYSKVISNATSGEPRAVDVWQGHQYCFFVTLGQALPFFYVLVAVFYLSVGVLKLPFVIASAGTQLLVQVLSFTHARR